MKESNSAVDSSWYNNDLALIVDALFTSLEQWAVTLDA